MGEPHWHAAATAKVLGAGWFDRLLGSLHCLPDGDGFAEPPGLYGHRAAAEVVREYLAEVARLVTESDVFSVLAHIDYPIRSWPQQRAGPFDRGTGTAVGATHRTRVRHRPRRRPHAAPACPRTRGRMVEQRGLPDPRVPA